MKTRIAPTPSGFLHLGNILCFAVTAALAKKTKAKIFLRIDDMDRERVRKEYVQDIFDTLNFLEIPWDEGPRDYVAFEKEYSQVHRLDIYNKALQQLKDQGHVFACTCSRAKVQMANTGGIYAGSCRHLGIPYNTENACWRLRTIATKEVIVNTLNNGVVKATLPATMSDFVIRKRDKFPAYQLTSLIDDVHFGIDLVVRGADLWDATLAQLSLAAVLAEDTFPKATFYHHQLLTGPGGSKLSKSAGATSVQYLRREYKKPSDIYTLIASMLGTEHPVRNWEELGLVLVGH